jgi:uncharacterized delta-60 repeat protein
LQNQKTAYINLDNKIPNRSFSKGGFMTRVLLTFFFIFFFTLPLFAQSVDTAWVRRYKGPGGGSNDEAFAIAVDGSGNVYVTGCSYYSWPSYSDYATIKYDPDGNELWVRRYNGPASYYDYASAIAVDGSGNVYVTGYSLGSGTSEDYATLKYDPDGNQLWVKRYNGPGNDYDRAFTIAVDGSGNVYVTGFSEGSGTFWDYATLKYDPAGNQLWVKRYNGPGNDHDQAFAIAVDGSGNVYVTGYSDGSGTSEDYATLKYDPDGTQLWVKRYNGPGNDYDWASAIAVDSSGNVYVTGYSVFGGTSADYATIKYDPDGNELWVKRYDGPGNYYDYVSAIAVDGSGNVYVTGVSYGSGTGEDYATVKYDPDGNQLWEKRYNGPGNEYDWASAIALDGSGNVYVTGRSWGSGTCYDYATVKYDPDGNQLWEKRYNGPGNDHDRAFAIAVDGSGNVYVTGYSVGSGTGEDYATIKYVQFLRGDANKDSKVSLADIVYLINYLFKFGPAPEPIQSGDANCDGKVSLSDIVYLINYLFKFGPAPCI